jgi:FMN phosphatase YigB (HAD superfamily)
MTPPRAVSLLPYCDFTVISVIEGTKKPDPRLFERALERPESSAHAPGTVEVVRDLSDVLAAIALADGGRGTREGAR